MRARNDLAVIQTADFITPIVDDPYFFGKIAAANSYSDIYAMGGSALSAINLVCWPPGLDEACLEAMLQGASEVAAEAGAPIIGGHTVADDELKYGLAVNGTVHPDAIVRNVGAQAGDVLFLTKPLGTGILSVALRKGHLDASESDAMITSMCRLNKEASEMAVAVGARAMTDVTGFGLAGHLGEMLGNDDQLGVSLNAEKVPLLPGVKASLEKGYATCGAAPNREAVGERMHIEKGLSSELDFESILCDPQTSGGLLIAMPEARTDDFHREARHRGIDVTEIGRFNRSGRIEVTA